MKDRQVEHTPAQSRIPFVSAFLHCVSMTVIVFLRSGFGYAYLRPKSVFISFSWAFLLFTTYAWLEPGKWRGNAVLCLFGLTAMLLYAVHLTAAFVSELRGNATHDNDSGTPHMLRLPRSAAVPQPDTFRAAWVMWAEPALVLLAAFVARWPLGATNLSTWFFLTAPCLWLKEFLNHWLQIRQQKRRHDSMEDAKDGLQGSHAQTDVPPTATSLKGKVRRKRAP